MIRDLRVALRNIRRAPGAALAIAATIGLGIAAAATLFAVVDALFLRPLPGVGHPAGLVNVHATEPDGSTFHSVSYPDWQELDRSPDLPFTGLAAFSSRLVSVAAVEGRKEAAATAEPRLAVAQIVTENFFRVLEARPHIGRFFADRESAPTLVLSYAAWRDRLAADPAAVGRTVLVDGLPFTVIGVAAPGFEGNFLAQPFDVWIPISASDGVRAPGDIQSPDRKWLELVGRRRAGVGLEAASAALATLARRLERLHPVADRGLGFDARPATGFEDSLRTTATAFFAVLGLLGLSVLAIACANVTGLLLARSLAREKEIGIRIALGEGRGSLVTGLLVETLVLFSAGGVLGITLASWGARALERFRVPAPVPISFDFAPGARTVAFAAAASLVAGIVFGLFPALVSTRPDLLALLRSGASTERVRTSRARTAFVGAQVAFSVLLLVAAGLFQESIRRAALADPGFRPDGVATTRVDLSLLSYDPIRARGAFDRLLATVAASPGVESASIASPLPLGPARRTARASLPGSAPDARRTVDSADVGGAYFETLGIPILRGRAFGREDRADAIPVVIVNETLARTLWGAADPVGRTLVADDRLVRVVGVARDGKYRSLAEPPTPFAYFPASQSERTSYDIVVRGGASNASRGPEALAAPLRRAIRDIDPAIPAGAVVSMRSYIGFSTLLSRVAGSISAALGSLGLLLTAIGLAGLVAHSVSRRRREIGLRLAVGALPRDILRLEMRRAAVVAAGGFVAGALAAILVTPLLSRFLFGVRGTDPATYAGVGAVLLTATLLASWLPARRGARMDPLAALRSE